MCNAEPRNLDLVHLSPDCLSSAACQIPDSCELYDAVRWHDMETSERSMRSDDRKRIRPTDLRSSFLRATPRMCLGERAPGRTSPKRSEDLMLTGPKGVGYAGARPAFDIYASIVPLAIGFPNEKTITSAR